MQCGIAFIRKQKYKYISQPTVASKSQYINKDIVIIGLPISSGEAEGAQEVGTQDQEFLFKTFYYWTKNEKQTLNF